MSSRVSAGRTGKSAQAFWTPPTLTLFFISSRKTCFTSLYSSLVTRPESWAALACCKAFTSSLASVILALLRPCLSRTALLPSRCARSLEFGPFSSLSQKAM